MFLWDYNRKIKFYSESYFALMISKKAPPLIHERNLSN